MGAEFKSWAWVCGVWVRGVEARIPDMVRENMLRGKCRQVQMPVKVPWACKRMWVKRVVPVETETLDSERTHFDAQISKILTPFF